MIERTNKEINSGVKSRRVKLHMLTIPAGNGIEIHTHTR